MSAPLRETSAQEIQRYVGWTEADALCVAASIDLVRPHFRRIAQTISNRSKQHVAANAVFKDDAQIERLEESMVDWLEELFSCRHFDDAHFQRTIEVGRIHVRSGLAQRYIVGAMSLIRTALMDALDENENEENRPHGASGAVSRLLDVELAVMLESYHDERAELQKRSEQERLSTIGKLAAGLAHEIRNPLNGAQLHIKLLTRAIDQNNAGDAKESTRVVESEMHRVARLVTDFLDFALTRPLQREKILVATLFARVMVLIGRTANLSNVRVSTDLESESLHLEADVERLERVLVNLVHNAIEASASATSHDGEKCVVMRATNKKKTAHDSAAAVYFEVEDNGPGLNNADESVIFDPFYSTKPQGTGLGLSIVKRIVDDHGGCIDVESAPGKTRFRIELPTTQRVTA